VLSSTPDLLGQLTALPLQYIC